MDKEPSAIIGSITAAATAVYQLTLAAMYPVTIVTTNTTAPLGVTS